MAKYFLILLLGSLQPLLSSAQSTWFKEWFQQKSTQREYLINQIAALKVYAGYLKKGYDIYRTGHRTIGNFKRGELNLHTDFFNSLKAVNPEVARYARVADIVALQMEIVRRSGNSLRSARKAGSFHPEEIAYMGRVYDRLLGDCGALLDELLSLTTSGQLEMADDERLQRIDLLYAEMQDNYRFAETFSNEAGMLSAARQQEQSDIHLLRQLSGDQP